MSAPPNNKDGDHIGAAIASFKAVHRAVADEDSTYKRKILFWSRLTFGAVTLYTGFTGILLLMNKCSLDETRTEFEINQRPWVYADETAAAGPLTFDANGRIFRLKVQFHNSGNTPATFVYINGLLIIDEPSESFSPFARRKTQQRRCAAVRDSQSTNPQTQLTLFPKTHWDVSSWGAYVKREDIEKARRQQGMLRTLPYLIFCMDYRFTYTNDPHLTTELFSLTSDTPVSLFSMNAGDPSIPVKLLLEGTYAD